MLITDRISIGTKREVTKEGYLKVPGKISRKGTQVYYASELGLTDREPNEEVIVYRDPLEVFSPASMASFSNKPVTNDHPPELVNTSNFKKYSVGVSANDVRIVGDYLEADLIIMDEQAIEDINAGKSELSNGYTCDVDILEGISEDGEKYNAVQRNIVGNHIAIVSKGRAGYNCRVADKSPQIEVNIMDKIIIDGVAYEAPEQTVQAVNKLQTRLADAEKAVTEKDEDIKRKDEEAEEKDEAAKRKEDTLKAEADDALSKVPSAEQLDSLVADRQKVIADATRIMPTLEWAGKTNDAIRSEVVAAKCKGVVMDSVSADYILARFEGLLDSAPANSLDSALSHTVVADGGQTKETDNVNIVDSAREGFAEKARNAWKTNEGEK